MPDYERWISDKTAEFHDLFTRMDTDEDLAVLKTYKMFDKDDRREPDVEELTFNDPMVYANRVESNLIKAHMQPDVRGVGLSDEDVAVIEDFIKDYTLAIDESLVPRDIASLMAFNVQQICHRGRMITRSTPSYKKGVFDPGVLPMDARYTLYEFGRKNLKAISYTRMRNKTQIESEYGAVIAEQMAGTEQEVTDLWHEDKEIVYIGNVEAKNEKHGYDELPFVIQVCPSGLMFRGQDMIARSGESIFAPNRALYEPKNRLGSILMTLTIMSFMGGLQYESEQGIRAQKPELPPYGKRKVAPIDKGTRGYFNMPINDVKEATKNLIGMVISNIQDGSLPPVSFGNIQFPMSGAGIESLKEAEDPIYLPRLEALARYYQRFYRLIIQQYIDLGLNIKLGGLGNSTQYNYTDLDKDYNIMFRFFATSPKQNMVNISTAAAYGDSVSEDFKRREVLQLENPDAEEAKIWAEKAPFMSPAVAKYKVIEGLLARGKLIEANLMAEELGLTIDQIMSGNMGEQKEVEVPNRPIKQLMPLIAGKVGAGEREEKSPEPASETTTEEVAV